MKLNQNSHCEPIEQNYGYQIIYHKDLNQQNTYRKKREPHMSGDRLVYIEYAANILGMCSVLVNTFLQLSL